MPELPEVETTRRSVEPLIKGALVQAVRLGKPLRWPLGCEPARLCGQHIQSVQRRGKYLWLALDRGGLLIHLGMSGALQMWPQAPPAGPHDHFDLLTSAGCLRLTDPRRFGAVVWSASMHEGMAQRLLSHLGPEPLEDGFDAAALHAALRGRKGPIKALLMNAQVVVGVGNIYASEALFRARIHPLTPAHALGMKRCARLVEAVRAVLSQALALGGSTLRDFRDVHGMEGAFQQQAQVYGREGQACAVCGAAIRRLVLTGRSSFFCSDCQRR
jgi:formamidopyrimidine-DNA glycosylase